MSETGPIKSPDDLPILFSLPHLSIDRHGVPTGELTVVTEDGRPLRIIAARSLGWPHTEITVAEEGA